VSQVEPGRDVNVVLQGTGSVKPGPRARDRYYHSVRTATSWFTLVFLQPGPETEVLREHVLPLLETIRSCCRIP
jgi:hypothetical protein